MVLAHFIQLFSLPDDGNLQSEMYLYGSILVLMAFITIFLVHHGTYHFNLTGMRCRIALSSLVYRKVSNTLCTILPFGFQESTTSILTVYTLLLNSSNIPNENSRKNDKSPILIGISLDLKGNFINNSKYALQLV